MTGELAPRTRPSRTSTALRWALFLLVTGFFAVALGERWSEVATSVGRLSWWVLPAALSLAVTGLLGTWWSWMVVLRSLGVSAPRTPLSRMFFVGQVGKYVPGAVWPVVLQLRYAHDLSVPRSTVAASFLQTLALGTGTALLCALLAVPALVQGTLGAIGWWLLLVLPVVALVLVHPRLAGASLDLVQRIRGREPLRLGTTWGTAGRASLGTLTFWLIGGLHLWVVVVDLGADPWTSLAVSVGGLALGMGLGPLIAVLPAGAGIREVVVVAALSAVLDLPAAVAAALVSRAVLMVADGALAVGSLVWPGGSARTAGAA